MLASYSGSVSGHYRRGGYTYPSRMVGNARSRVAALEDRSSRGATAAVLSAIYEEDFLDGGNIGPEREQTVALLLGEHAWTLPFAACKLGLGGFECVSQLSSHSRSRPRATNGCLDRRHGSGARRGSLRSLLARRRDGHCLSEVPRSASSRSAAASVAASFAGSSGGDEGPRDGLVDLNAANC